MMGRHGNMASSLSAASKKSAKMGKYCRRDTRAALGSNRWARGGQSGLPRARRAAAGSQKG